MNIVINNAENLIESLKKDPNLREAVTRYILEENPPPLPNHSDQPNTLDNQSGHQATRHPRDTPEAGNDPVKTLTLEALNTAKQAIGIAAEARDAAPKAAAIPGNSWSWPTEKQRNPTCPPFATKLSTYRVPALS